MKNIFKSKRNILIMMFALVVIMGIGFAAYSQQLRINDTSSIDSNWDIYIKDVSVPSKTSGATGTWNKDTSIKLKAELTTDLKYPGDYVIYNITVANDGTIDAILEKINFSMEKEDTVINYYYSVDDQTTWNKVTKNGENPYNEDLLANTTDEFQVKVEYDPTKTGTATDNQKSNKLTLNLDYAQKTGGEVVPSNTASFGGQTVTLAEAGTDGLYADEYEEGRYIYKGSSPDNYITFNNESWRIISVELDGTLKIIRQENIYDIPFDSSGLRDGTSNGAGGTYCALSGRFGCNAWAINDNFTNGNKSGTVLKDAGLNTYLNTTFLGTINEDSKYIVNHDFNVGSPGNSSDVDDMATNLQQEALYKWNGKIGLMNITDVLRVTQNEGCTSLKVGYDTITQYVCSANNWLWTNASYELTISPFSNYPQSVWMMMTIGRIDSSSAKDTGRAVRPVLYLKSDITLSGSGAIDDPYTINS